MDINWRQVKWIKWYVRHKYRQNKSDPLYKFEKELINAYPGLPKKTRSNYVMPMVDNILSTYNNITPKKLENLLMVLNHNKLNFKHGNSALKSLRAKRAMNTMKKYLGTHTIWSHRRMTKMYKPGSRLSNKLASKYI